MTWDLIGHEWAVQLLQGHIKNNTLRHAYLITGPSDIGKKNLAIRFIQAICCPKPKSLGIPCLECPTCSRLQRMEHPDLFPIIVEEGSKQIKIDQVRELVHNLSLSPYEASRRFGLLVDFELANRHTQNSLLKTLEEPPGSAILILTAVSASALFETVASRCEEIKLNPVPIQTTRQGLERMYQIPEDQADFLAHISAGKPELALAYHQDPEILERRNTLLNQHNEILGGDSVARFAYANQLVKDPSMVQELLYIWSSIWHDVLLQAGNSDTPIRNIDRDGEIQTITNALDLQDAKSTLNLFRRAYSLLQKNANLKLTVEDLLLQLPTIHL
jgi:DNA polymerase III subunit delta'